MSEEKARDRQTHDAKAWIEQQRAKQARGTSSFAPHTPPAQRSLSTFSSPGSILGRDDDAIIIELTPRCLYAGIEGDSGPQCRISYGPESSRKIGDYRAWTPGYKRPQEDVETWGRSYELWRNNVRDMDLGLLSDMLERTVREAYNKYLLVDAGASRLVLVLPSLTPHPVLETVLSTLFQRWKYSSITLLPASTMSVISAGVRSALVVDIGWEETTATAIYEYREIDCKRSIQAVKKLSQVFASTLKKVKDAQPGGSSLRFDHGFIEDILFRVMATVNNHDFESNDLSSSSTVDSDFEIEWPGQPSTRLVKISKTEFIKLLKNIFIIDKGNSHPDDHETPLPQLVYRSLLTLSPDVRGICMSRIIFTGQGSESLSVRNQILQGVNLLIERHGWSTVRGQHAADHRKGLSEIAQGRSNPTDAKHNLQLPVGKDYVEERLRKQKAKLLQPVTQGDLREVRSLGAWTGASLLTSLKIRGFVEIDRERFLSHGLSGASREVDISVVPPQRMSSFGLPTSNKSADRSSWTLAGWG